MHRPMCSRRLSALFALPLALCAGLAQAGPLDPPAGPIAPTAKPLSEIEPRIAVSLANTPGDADSVFRITQPGSYYLTGNVVGAPGPKDIGIEISGPHVTLDLNGFSIEGMGNLVTGIAISGANVAVRNGTVRNLTAGRGVWITNVGAIVEDVRLLDTAGPGLRIDAEHATLRRVHVRSGIIGVDAANAEGLQIFDSMFIDCSGFGIRAGAGALIENVRVIDAFDAAGNVIGIQVGVGARVRDSQVLLAPAANGIGIAVTSRARVEGCDVRTAGANAAGINAVGTAAVIRENTITGNTLGSGILLIELSRKSRIESNTISDYPIGLQNGNSIGNYVVGNVFSGVTNPIVNVSDINTIVGPLVTTASDTTLTNPLANFSN